MTRDEPAHPRHRPLAGVLPLLAIGAGCVPAILPPTHSSVHMGTTIGTVAGQSRTGEPETRTDSGVVQMRAETRPLQMVEDELERCCDFGLGYVGDFHLGPSAGDEYVKHGPSASVLFFPAMGSLGSSSVWRLHLTATGDLLLGRAGAEVEVGGGASLGLGAEMVGFFEGPAAGGGDRWYFAGWGFGEASFGVSVAISYRRIHGLDHAMLAGGLTVGAPAAIGLFGAVP